MDIVREGFDWFYQVIKSKIFKKTENDPKIAHELFVNFCKFLRKTSLDRIIFDHSDNRRNPGFELSNAARFNKDGQIHPLSLKYIGFDRVVIGTVTFDPWKGTPRPSTRRYIDTYSLINWEGLPGIGAIPLSDTVATYGNHGVPITINFMSTPEKEGDELLRDLEGTIVATRDLPQVTRYELNISCPNTHTKDGADTRAENLKKLDEMLVVVERNVYAHQEIYFKVSPDSTQADIKDTISVAMNHRINGIVACNTTTKHDRIFIPESPVDKRGNQIGGASGDAVYKRSLKVQRSYHAELDAEGLDWDMIAVGGIRNRQRVAERKQPRIKGMQIYTPILFPGIGVIRDLRRYKSA